MPEYTRASATHWYLCLKVVRFTFNNRQMNCCHQPCSLLGYSYHELLKLSSCLIVNLCLFSLAAKGLPVRSLHLGVLCSLYLPGLPQDREGECCRCGLCLRICARVFSRDDWVSTPYCAILSVVVISSKCWLPSPLTWHAWLEGGIVSNTSPGAF